jgi:L-seryl-tRNA(Ser) seleniumtransferase
MDELLNTPWAAQFSGSLGRELVKTIIAGALDHIRDEIRQGTPLKAPPDELAVGRAKISLGKRMSSTLRPVINATGVVVHTNLGRAPLAAEALRAVQAIAGAYSTLEYSLEKGGRGSRSAHVEWLVCQLTGAEAALVVNNNAAAALLALSATAAGREVIVSCGELVEIGDSFRIPELLAFSGAKMIAVGCTNSTRISDYRDAITENTAVLLKVHPSNYCIEGFVSSTPRESLAELAASHGLVFLEDLGSGLLGELEASFVNANVSREYPVRDCLKAGSGIVTFSGDKLLGGPQIGVIAGSKDLIDKMRGHQLLRALRVDKMTLAAFEATLRLYLSGRQKEIPVIGMIETDQKDLLKKARKLCRVLKETAEKMHAGDFVLSVTETRDAVGGGAYPTGILGGFGVAIRHGSAEPWALAQAKALAAGMRTAAFPVIAGISDGSVILHVRTLLKGEEDLIPASFAQALRTLPAAPPLDGPPAVNNREA